MMTIELTLLVWSTGLFALYVGVQSILYRLQHGVEFAATGRDDEPPPDKWNARAQKALRNLLETYPVFAVLAVAAALGRGDALSLWGAWIYLAARVVYLPLYVLGVKYIRSAVWTVSAIGLILMFVGVAF
jgi:uncharacterized MAPEG superfamily protein